MELKIRTGKKNKYTKFKKSELRLAIFVACKIARTHSEEFLKKHHLMFTPEAIEDTEKQHAIWDHIVSEYYELLEKEKKEKKE